MKRILAVLVVVVIFGATLVLSNGAQPAAAATGAASHAAVTTKVHTGAFDKTRFVAHLAVTAYLIHYIYKKYKEGKLGRFHIFTDIKAAAAALIAYHEIKVAYGIAKGSSSKTLQALVSPIGAISNGLNTAVSKLKHGDTSVVSSLNTQESGLASLASKSGFGYKDMAPSGFSGF